MTPRSKLFLELLETGCLPASRLQGSRAALRTPFDTGILVKHPKGAGEVVEVAKPSAFRDWLGHTFPGALGGMEASSPRASNIAMNRNSKRGRRGLDYYVVSARAHRVNPLLTGDEAIAMANLVETTRRWGAASLFLGIPGMERSAPDPLLPMGIRVMTMEAPECFDRSERIRNEADVFLLSGTGGRLREALIDWLARQESIQVIHFGDYDPVGLQEFSRLAAKLPGRASLFVPEDVEDRFRKFSNRGLMEKGNNRAVLGSLKGGLHPSSDRILDLISIYGPLEQEALLIDVTCHPQGDPLISPEARH